ncbi:diaminopropionate ammonia-lyase [Mesorhizobium sp. A623]
MMNFPRPSLKSYVTNPNFSNDRNYPDNLKSILSVAHGEVALQEIETWAGYEKTTLVSLDGLASKIGIGGIYYKDESGRFELNSFKALGGAYAVLRILQKRVEDEAGVKIGSADLISGKYSHITEKLTVCCATDGNHGRSVAWGAQIFGCQCVIFIHATVSDNRKTAIEKYGAKVIRVEGNYDDSVRRADAEATTNGWTVVSDTSYEGYMDIPRDVMRGYTVIAAEIVEQIDENSIPTHVFIQSGVGGLAAAVCGYFWEVWGDKRPTLVVVEPQNADCFTKSVAAGRLTSVHGDLETMMAGLSCGEVSTLAWDILNVGANASLTVSDEAVAACMKLLSLGQDGDAPIVAGESAVGGVVGLLAALDDENVKAELGLNANSRVLFIGSEGATDPELYNEIIGRSTNDALAAV